MNGCITAGDVPPACLLGNMRGTCAAMGNVPRLRHTTPAPLSSLQGFLPNMRLQRAAGYAAVELAQALRQVLAARRAGRQHWVRSEGSSGQGGVAGRHLFGWRDAMDIVVKWRQLAEPNDQASGAASP
jgi:hypothetical protein